MNAKFVVAVLVALQVSLSLCDYPEADPDVVIKYNDMKETFKRRLVNVYNKVMAATADNANAQIARDAIANNEKMGTLKEVVSAIAEEVEPALDGARARALGVYSAHLRPYIGEYLQDAIDKIKVVLDQVMPADQQS